MACLHERYENMAKDVLETKALDTMKPVIKLRFPIDFEGEKINEIELDLLKLTGRAQRQAEKRYVGEGGVPGAGRASDDYCVFLAAEAAGLPSEAFDLLIGPDFAEVILMVQNFLLDTPWMREQSASSA